MTTLIGIYGLVGSGKTLLATRMALLSKTPVICNYDIYNNPTERKPNPNVHPLEVDELLDLKYNPAKIIIDEAYAWLECRVSNSNVNKYMSYVLFQSRKRGLDFIITAQLEDTIDNRFTKMCSYIIFAEMIQDGFQYWITDKHKIKTFIIPFKQSETIWNKYNTDQIIMPPTIDNLKTQVAILDRSKLKKKLDELEQKLIAEYGNETKYTHSLIDNFLLDIDESDVYGSYLYARMQKLAITQK